MTELRGYCRKCGGTFAGQMLCPNCGIQLRRDGERTSEPAPKSLAEPADGPSFMRRMLLGTVVSFGMAHGLKHALIATLMVFSGSTAIVLSMDRSAILVLISTFFAGVVAGCSNRRAEAAGFLLGLIGAVGIIGLEISRGTWPPSEWLIGLPLVNSFIGIMGGLAGRLVYSPAPRLPKIASSNTRIQTEVAIHREPIGFLRIIIGSILAASGVIFAEPIRDQMGRMLGGNSGTFTSSRFVVWQISLLASVIGGIIAGSNMRHGIRQGAIAGVLVTMAIVVACLQIGVRKITATDFWAFQFDVSASDPKVIGILAATSGMVCIIGGWLGAQILPRR